MIPSKVNCEIGTIVECIVSGDVKRYEGGFEPRDDYDAPKKLSTFLKCVGIIDGKEKIRGETYYRVKIKDTKIKPPRNKDYFLLHWRNILRIL